MTVENLIIIRKWTRCRGLWQQLHTLMLFHCQHWLHTCKIGITWENYLYK